MMLSRRISFRPHTCFGSESERAEIGEQMSKDLELVRCGKTVELQHDRRVKRSDVAMPHVARHAGKKNVGVTSFECAHHRQFGNGMPLAKIFAKEKRVDARGVAAHDDVLVVVGKNLRLNEVAWAQQVRYRACF